MDHQVPRFYVNQILTLSDEDLSLLMTCASTVDLKKGEFILKEGEVCRAFYLVEKGYLRTWFNKDGTEINLGFAFEGDFTSNLKSFRSRQKSDVNIEAGENTTLWIFSRDVLSEEFGSHPQITRFVRRLAINLLLASEEHSDLFKIYTPTERYRYIEKNNPKLLQRISLSQISSYLGVARETLSRIRGKNH